MTRVRCSNYVRDNGAIAYGLPLLSTLIAPASLVSRLVESGLSWYWNADVPSNVPVTGENENSWNFTRLDSVTSTALGSALVARNADGYLHFVALIGADGALPLSELRRALSRFAVGGESPIRMVVVQIGDQEEDLVFLAKSHGLEEQNLLISFGIDRCDVVQRPYSKLMVARLESMFRLSETSP